MGCNQSTVVQQIKPRPSTKAFEDPQQRNTCPVGCEDGILDSKRLQEVVPERTSTSSIVLGQRSSAARRWCVDRVQGGFLSPFAVCFVVPDMQTVCEASRKNAIPMFANCPTTPRTMRPRVM